MDARHRLLGMSLGLALASSCAKAPPATGDVDQDASTPVPASSGAASGSAQGDVAAAAVAIELPSTYEVPPKDVVDIVDAPATPRITISPTRERVLLAHYDALPSIEDVAAPFERLAGLRIDAARYAQRRTRMYERLEIVDVSTGQSQAVMLPDDMRMGPPQWSPDGGRVAFTRWQEDGLHLWVVDAASGQATELEGLRVNDILTRGFQWLPHGKGLIAFCVPPDAERPPQRPRRPVGPSVSDTAGEKATNRTYQDLLTDPFDEALFEHLVTVQLLEVDMDSGATRSLGEPGLFAAVDVSPGGEYVLVERIRRPFSYTVPFYRFPMRVEVWDRAAKVVRTVADLELAEEIPIGGVRQGPRRVQWHPQHPDTLVWVEALDEGDPKRDAEHRDRVMVHAAGFADVPKILTKVEHRFTDISWTDQPGQYLISDFDRDRRWTTTRVHDPSGERVLVDRSVRDAYGDPGTPVYQQRTDGSYVVPVDGDAIMLSGSGATPDGYRPFVQRMDLRDGKTQRTFESGLDEYASFVDVAASGELIVWRESKTDVPNLYVQHDDGKRRPLTTFVDPHPQLTGIDKRILKYTRDDGVELSGTLYLPPGYQEGDRLPLVVWAYPIEFNDKDTAGQVRASDNRFTRLQSTSPLMFLTQGYAVLDGAAMPIVGDPETMNDTFLPQIVGSASAAIEAVVALGVADRDRVGVAGHSYGAFMAANLLAHSDLFRAGIARSGAYNRTLTPFGFQSERRTLWEAPQAYVNVSPLFAADRLDEPILLVHGEDDDNSGTFPLQSQRLFHALKGNGGTARLVMLPKESHGYVARESVLHVLAESFRWFDQHVKRAPSDREDRKALVPEE